MKEPNRDEDRVDDELYSELNLQWNTHLDLKDSVDRDFINEEME